MPNIVTLPGDGIGPEVLDASLRVLGQVAPDLDYTEHEFGGASIDAPGTALSDDVLAACRDADAVLLAAVGGPKWDTTNPDAPRPEQGLLGVRKGLGLFANLRPVRPSTALLDASPLRRERIERIARVAFEAAGERRGRVTSVDKANVLETSRLWRETVTRLAPEYDGIELDHLLVDNAAMQLVSRPADFDVIVTENLFGDILSDEAAMLTGSLGMLPSASLGEEVPGLYEPVHGSAPDIAGQGIANPLATFLSVALMLRYGLGLHDEADRLDAAVDSTLAAGLRTPDLAVGEGTREGGTKEMTQAVLAELV